MHVKFLKNIKTTFTYFVWGLSGAFFLFLALITSYIAGKNRRDSRCYFFITYLFSRTCIWSTFITYSIKGLRNLPTYPETPGIILINHSSMVDIPLVEVLLKSYPRVWFSNDYSKYPLLGRLLNRMHIILDRKKPIEALRKAVKFTKNKHRHLLIFPEGTRHTDGKIHTFHGGFAVLAEQLDRPIIPIAMTGLHKICPKKQYLIDSSASKVKISIGKPMYYDPATPRQKFIDDVQRWFVEEINALKG